MVFFFFYSIPIKEDSSLQCDLIGNNSISTIEIRRGSVLKIHSLYVPIGKSSYESNVLSHSNTVKGLDSNGGFNSFMNSTIDDDEKYPPPPHNQHTPPPPSTSSNHVYSDRNYRACVSRWPHLDDSHWLPTTIDPFVFHCFIEQWYFYPRTMVTWRWFIGFRIDATSCANNFQRLVSVPFSTAAIVGFRPSRFPRRSLTAASLLIFVFFSFFFQRYLGLLLWGIPTLGSTPL